MRRDWIPCCAASYWNSPKSKYTNWNPNWINACDANVRPCACGYVWLCVSVSLYLYVCQSVHMKFCCWLVPSMVQSPLLLPPPCMFVDSFLKFLLFCSLHFTSLAFSVVPALSRIARHLTCFCSCSYTHTLYRRHTPCVPIQFAVDVDVELNRIGWGWLLSFSLTYSFRSIHLHALCALCCFYIHASERGVWLCGSACMCASVCVCVSPYISTSSSSVHSWHWLLFIYFGILVGFVMFFFLCELLLFNLLFSHSRVCVLWFDHIIFVRFVCWKCEYLFFTLYLSLFFCVSPFCVSPRWK